MEKFIINFNRSIILYRGNLSIQYEKFLNSNQFWKLAFIAISLSFFVLTYFTFELSLVFGFIILSLVVFNGITLLPVIYYRPEFD